MENASDVISRSIGRHRWTAFTCAEQRTSCALVAELYGRGWSGDAIAAAVSSGVRGAERSQTGGAAILALRSLLGGQPRTEGAPRRVPGRTRALLEMRAQTALSRLYGDIDDSPNVVTDAIGRARTAALRRLESDIRRMPYEQLAAWVETAESQAHSIPPLNAS